MDQIYLPTFIHLAAALLAGGLIGLERTFHGRPAGFRTHTLVCMASSALMLLTVYQNVLFPHLPVEAVRIDPTRMAQGIMTGIGFLGAGVIMKEGLTVRGLTTAASIWMTATIGILIGVGFYFGSVVAALMTLGTLSLFRRLESKIPSLFYSRLTVKTFRKDTLPEEALCKIITDNDCKFASPHYQLSGEGKYIQYLITVRTRNRENYRRLTESLLKQEQVLEFSLSPIGN